MTPPEPLDISERGIREAAIANLQIRCGHGRELAAGFADVVLEAVALRIAAAERDRIRQLVLALAKTTNHGASDDSYHAYYNLADMLKDQP